MVSLRACTGACPSSNIFHQRVIIADTQLIYSIWNFAGAKSLVIVTANAPHSPGQRVDIEIIDGSERGNVYLSKKVGV